MRNIWFFGLLGLMVSITSICAAEIPDLMGNWTGSAQGYHVGTGYVEEAEYVTLSLSIEEQNGRLFTGNMTYLVGGVEIVEGFAGAIGADNKTLYIAEFGSGYDVGTVISEDEIELIYLQDGELAEVFIDKLYRVVE